MRDQEYGARQYPNQEPCHRENDQPDQSEINKIRQITIEELDRGFIVRVGCTSFAISTKEDLLTQVNAYINNPKAVEQMWHDGNLF